MLKTKLITSILAVLLALGLLIAVVAAQTTSPTADTTTNEALPNHFGELIATAKASGKAITFDFIVPLITGERVWTLPDDIAKRSISAIGADYVCFSEPWNAGSRERCTAFTNISSITFLK
ncbi:MAG: hypothetical protein ABI970_08140 [Chloroflexota bacterium]